MNVFLALVCGTPVPNLPLPFNYILYKLICMYCPLQQVYHTERTFQTRYNGHTCADTTKMHLPMRNTY